MRVLFLTSHPDGEKALSFLMGLSRWDEIDVKMTGRLDPYPEQYDLGISFMYNYLIPAEQLTSERTWINFHPAPLPEYRGRNVGYHAVMNEAKTFGATLHYIDETFDTGDIIARKMFPIGEGDTAGYITARARFCCLDLFRTFVPAFLQGTHFIGEKQSGGTYYKKTPIDPNVTLTSEQQRQVRAITAPPYYAETTIGGVTYVIIPKSLVHHTNDESSDVAPANAGALV